ncbi:MAG TPA: APH(3') family aminoglycoside O-phosphotransferase [Devosia sp.]|jgi:aminoglycoside 3'-phosphotransferase-2|nr:APH(3') family aminoglycoside O-phosphotransferase [Devosia sp.]
MSSPAASEFRPARLGHLVDLPWQRVTIGESLASVWLIEGSEGNLFLKAAPTHGPNELPDEVARLEWLAPRGLPAPKVLDFFAAQDQHWLLMTAIPGADITSLVDDPALLCSVLAESLRQLHALDPTLCPFDNTLPRQLEKAAGNVAAGWVDETDFGDEFAGWRSDAVLDWAWANQPRRQDLVVTHGDACLPNILAEDGAFSGIIDVGRLGVADRWQDLALACRSIIYNCGEEHVAPFVAAYGAAWDGERYRYYCALDELF